MEWPFQALPARYVTPFGGCSTDLYPWQVGLNALALRENTSLASGARVLVSAEGAGAPRSILSRALYEVVALHSDASPEATALSPSGEAVFSAFELDGDARGRSVLQRLAPRPGRAGATVVLNAATSAFGPSF